MRVLSKIPGEQRCDYLFLLVGGNPLPNAVSGVLLPFERGRVFLIHSAATWEVANALSDWLANNGKGCQLLEVDEADAVGIYSKVADLLSVLEKEAWLGLNYTGGTKTMAVHAYRAVADWATNHGASVRFSYLDARTLRLYFDQPKQGSRSVYVGDSVEMSLADLLAIHQWRQSRPANQTPRYLSVARKLSRLCCDRSGWRQWRQWIGNVVYAQCRNPLPQGDKWMSPTELRTVVLDLPDGPGLQPVRTAMENAFGASGGRLPLRGMRNPRAFCDWIDGKWLEHLVLDAVLRVQNPVGFHEVWQSVEVEAVGGAVFEVDVVAIRGYQLFVFSCTTEQDRGRHKLKLFEASVRAQQMGGEEARVALVCCTQDPSGLEQEMRQQLAGPGKVAVFGCPHFERLSDHIEAWVQTQIGEP